MKTLNGEHYETSCKESAARVQASRAPIRRTDQQDLRVQNLRPAYRDFFCMSGNAAPLPPGREWRLSKRHNPAHHGLVSEAALEGYSKNFSPNGLRSNSRVQAERS